MPQSIPLAQRIQGPDDLVERLGVPPGYSAPSLQWLTMRDARVALNRLHGIEGLEGGISQEAIQQACLRYRHRLEGRTHDDEPVNLDAPEAGDPTPGPRELRCVWRAWPHRKLYLIDPSHINLEHLRLHWPNQTGAPGRTVGQGGGKGSRVRARPKPKRAKAGGASHNPSAQPKARAHARASA